MVWQPSKIFGDFLELVDRPAPPGGQGAHSLFKAIVEMVLNQGFLGLTDGFLDGVKLLRDVETRAAVTDHSDNAAQMPFGAFEALDDFGMGFVTVLSGHGSYLSPWRGYGKLAFSGKVSAKSPPAISAARICQELRCSIPGIV